MKEKLALNAFSGAALLILTIAIAFVLTPIIVRALGNRDYGIWEVVLVFVGYMSLLDLGVGPALVRTFAYEAAQERREAIEEIFSTALFALGAIGLLAFLAFAALASFPALVVGSAAAETSVLPGVIALVGASLLIKFPGTVLTAHLLGLQRHWMMYTVRAGVIIVQAFATVSALTSWEGSGLLWLARITLAANLVEYLAYVGLLWHLEPGLRPRPALFSRAVLARLYRFGAKSILGQLSERLRVQAMPVVIAQVIGVERVVFYVLAQRLASYAAQIGAVLARPLSSHWSDLYGRERMDRMQADWLVTSRLLQFFYCGMALGIAFLGRAFVTQWVGPEYGAECGPLVVITASVLFFEGLAPNALGVLVGMDRHGRAGFILLGSAVFAIVAAAILGRQLDLEGVALSYAAASACSTTGVMILGCRAIGVSPHRHLRSTLLPLIPALLGEGLALYAMQHAFGEAGSFGVIALRGLVGGLVYVALWWASTLSSEERALLIGLAGGLLRRRPGGSDHPA